MEIRDPVHGAIEITPQERIIIDHPLVQRLRRIKQLGFGDLAFPGATHTRFLHSLGTMAVATRFFDAVAPGLDLPGERMQYFRQVVRLAGLLHDLGHPPLSHTTEAALAPLEQLGLPVAFTQGHDMTTHEDMTVKLIIASGLTPLIEQAGVDPVHVADVIQGIDYPRGAFVTGKIDYLPLLHQIISSEMDADRMDYLLRDSFFTGAKYGQIDISWLISNLRHVVKDKRAFLGLESRAVFAFEDFLLSRYHMFLMVYFHHKSVLMHRMLKRFFDAHPLQLPADPDGYLKCDDRYLLDLLANSQDPWARRITRGEFLKIAAEFRGPRPATDIEAIAQKWQDKGAVVEVVDSRFELSKYYSPKGPRDERPMAMFIVEGGRFVEIDKYTDLFARYAKERHIIRVYADAAHRDAIHRELMGAGNV